MTLYVYESDFFNILLTQFPPYHPPLWVKHLGFSVPHRSSGPAPWSLWFSVHPHLLSTWCCCALRTHKGGRPRPALPGQERRPDQSVRFSGPYLILAVTFKAAIVTMHFAAHTSTPLAGSWLAQVDRGLKARSPNASEPLAA